MDVQMADVTIHLDETLDHDTREDLRDRILALDGVMGVAHHDSKPHLMIVEYDPARLHAIDLLRPITDQGYHAELVGL